MLNTVSNMRQVMDQIYIIYFGGEQIYRGISHKDLQGLS